MHRALGVNEQTTENPLTSWKEFIIWFYCSETDFVGKEREREWAYLFGCAKNIVYLCPYKYTRDVWEDWIIRHFTSSYLSQISDGILLAFAGTHSPWTFAPSTPNGRSLWRCGTLYSEFVWHDLCKLCWQWAQSNQSFSRFNNVTKAWNITPAWHVICTGICYCKLTYL